MRFIFLALLLTGCTTMSEYRQGCYDGLDGIFGTVHDSADTKFENYKINVCTRLTEKRYRRTNPEPDFSKLDHSSRSDR